MPRNVLGIDPGSVSGAYAFLDAGTGAIIDVGDIPVVNRMVNAYEWAKLVAFWMPDLAVIELVSAFPKQGVSSAFNFGMGCGLIQGAVAANTIPMMHVSPSKWKKDMGLNSDGEKSRARAISIWPQSIMLTNKKDHGRAEALLLAKWYLDRWGVTPPEEAVSIDDPFHPGNRGFDGPGGAE